jgi:hypothetical protein
MVRRCIYNHVARPLYPLMSQYSTNNTHVPTGLIVEVSDGISELWKKDRFPLFGINFKFTTILLSYVDSSRTPSCFY